MRFYQDGQQLCTVPHNENLLWPPVEYCYRSSFYGFALTGATRDHHAYGGGSDHKNLCWENKEKRLRTQRGRSPYA